MFLALRGYVWVGKGSNPLIAFSPGTISILRAAATVRAVKAPSANLSIVFASELYEVVVTVSLSTKAKMLQERAFGVTHRKPRRACFFA